MKKLVLLAISLLLFTQVVSAQEYLAIKNIKVYVDDDKVSGIDDEGGDIDNVLPESVIKVKVTIENNYPRESKTEIEDIEISGTIFDIDDGDDLEEDNDIDDIKAGKDETVELEFEIPLEVEEDSFDFELVVEGENETGGFLNDSAFFTVKIEKEKHDVRIYRAELGSTELKCNRNTDLKVKVVNFGSRDEDDVELTVTNEVLEINKRAIIDNLDNDLTDDDSKFSKSYTITVPEDVEAGTYNIDVKVEYDDGDETDEKTVSLTVVDCETTKREEKKQETTKTETTKPAEDSTITVMQTQPVIPTAAVVTTPPTQSFWQANKYTILVVLAYIVVIVVAVLIIMQLVRKK
jgi:hypothetical protein